MELKERQQIVKEFIDNEEDGFMKNKHGRYFYYSEDKSQGIDLECYFEDLIEFVVDYIEQ